ncbi:minor glycoprotein [Simian hemorrhagic fever virus]|uniref:ORF2a' protein n=2 Tax=Simian hemorrhagic fever virus TaxID=38143 RepID=A0A077EP04_SHFV|nr:minor glycoprotein [Simian hemorrhagic fever virus]AAB63391.1 minor glycoprotein [Simian hemorrhagic fever virus]AIL48172.1 ORF2a' protein [Simian hemorrhagic fever virus]AIL48187.1 ORF2a' protein [Simian hemorrhagic fever virus]AIY55122.1 minor structural glycoprotein GP2' [Simian hemorrhagic fever virus]AIY55147.1 minor structural glycoprotein GP2' [Simian hemorrhagic fever virus]
MSFCPGLILLLVLLKPVDSFDFFHFSSSFKYYDHTHIHTVFRDLISHCETKIAPWAKHPLGIIGHNQFVSAYNNWVRRVYSVNPIYIEAEKGFKHYYSYKPECRSQIGYPATVHAGTREIDLPRLLTALKTYSVKEHSLCVRAAGLLARLHELRKQEDFNITDDTFTINYHLKESSVPWFQSGFYLQVYHASSFATFIAPLTLLIVLLIRKPRLLAFICPAVTCRFQSTSQPLYVPLVGIRPGPSFSPTGVSAPQRMSAPRFVRLPVGSGQILASGKGQGL